MSGRQARPVLTLEAAADALASAKNKLDSARWNANEPGASGDDKRALELAHRAYNEAVDDHQRAKTQRKLDEHRARVEEAQAAEDSEMARQHQARSDAAAIAMGAAAKRDERYGRRTGESAQDWVNRDVREKKALRSPGHTGQAVGPSIEAQNALDREGPGAAPAASTGAAPAASKAGRIPGTL